MVMVTDVAGQKKFSLEDIINNMDSLRVARIKTGRGLLTPYIAPAYTPEMKFIIAIGGLYTFKTQKNNPLLERSSIPFAFSYSTNRSFQLNAKLNLYGRGDRYRIIGDYWLKVMPDHYWGVGYNQGKDQDRSDTTTLYHRNWNKLYARFLYHIGKDFFAGLMFDWNRTIAKDLNPVMAADPYIREFGSLVNNVGIGAVVQYDSRDNILNAYTGKLVDIGLSYYGRIFGGHNEYWVAEVDYRGYIPVSFVKGRNTLAWETKLRTTWGDTPWTDLSLLGNPFDFRGYYWGRFRDKSMIFGLLEFRHMFNRKTPNKNGSYDSRHGFVTWVGMGSIGEKLNDLENWLPNAGIGYRFEVQPRMNLRLDVGFGLESSGFYINFAEGF